MVKVMPSSDEEHRKKQTKLRLCSEEKSHISSEGRMKPKLHADAYKLSQAAYYNCSSLHERLHYSNHHIFVEELDLYQLSLWCVFLLQVKNAFLEAIILWTNCKTTAM